MSSRKVENLQSINPGKITIIEKYLPERTGYIKHILPYVNNMKKIDYEVNLMTLKNQLKE